MKRKVFLSIASLCLCASFMTACTGASEKVVFNEYWYKDSTIATSGAETLKYAVSFEDGNGFGDSKLELDYTGTYTTILQSNQVYNEETGVYVYTTSLDVDVTFTVGSESVTKENIVETKVVFKTAKDGLRPLYSWNKYHSYIPNNYATSIENAYSESNQTIETVYNTNGTSGVCTTTDLLHDNKVTKDSFSVASKEAKKYTCLDVEQLYFALRGVNTSEDSSPTFLVYSSGNEAYQSITASFGSKVVGDTSFSGVSGIGGSVDYYPVSVGLNAELAGPSHSVWIATHSNPQLNTHRNVILKMNANLAYGMGTIVYTLHSAEFSN